MKNLLNLKTKLTCLLICFVIIFSFCGFGCKNKSNNPTNTTSSGQASSSSQVDITKFSQTLQNVLTKSYYNNLWFKYEENYKNGFINTLTTYAIYNLIPYGFLESKGIFNIEKIKNDELLSYSVVYLKNNDLYIDLRVEIEDSTNYLYNYLLKYTLTNQEIKEMYELSWIGANERESYIQLPFFIQELSYIKTPQVLSENYSSNNANCAAQTRVDNLKIFYNTRAFYESYQILNKYEATHIFRVYSFYGNDTSASCGVEIGKIEFYTFGLPFETIGNNMVNYYASPSGYDYLDNSIQNFKDSIENARGYCVERFRFYTIGINELYRRVFN